MPNHLLIDALENPWKSVRGPSSFVFPADVPFVESMNKIHKNSPNHKLRIELPPGPFAGPSNAPLVILLANPGYHRDDHKEQTSPKALKIILDGLREPSGTPFWPLTEFFEGTRAGNWWRPKVRDLADKVCGFEELAGKIQTIELHGYHSKNWTAPLVTFPSQYYGFELVRRAMARDALIVVVRAHRYWNGSVPGLLEYRRKVSQLSSSRNAYLSRRNLGKNFNQVVKALRE